jgi:adenylosuccinate lyase
LTCFSSFAASRAIYNDLTLADGQKVKAFEKVTNHDVKAVEYFIKEKFDAYGWQEHKEFIHFALTSQDINNSAVPLSLAEFVTAEYIPKLNGVVDEIRKIARDNAQVTMLAKTHGQSATPTRLGKEFMVFVERIEDQLELLQQIPFSCKFGGASGGFNAHHVAYPEVDWEAFADKFIAESLPASSHSALKMKRQRYTTQIEHYDKMGALFDTIKRINTILIDFCRDVWQYISMNYFKQKTKANEVGSSAMPHKVNPIDFENAEGNFGVANCVFEHFSAKLPISRLQRDLSDSTVSRNFGVPFSKCPILALKNSSLALNFPRLSL